MYFLNLIKNDDDDGLLIVAITFSVFILNCFN